MFVLSQALFLSFFLFFFLWGGGGERGKGGGGGDRAPCINLSVFSPEIFADLTASNLL